MQKKKVLFVCIHNSARSQMAQAYLNAIGGDRFEARSAGLEPGRLNPYVVRVLAEEGIDISGNAPTAVDDYLKQHALFDYVITVCDSASGERCPLFPGGATRLHWSFPDPSALTGTDDEKMQGTRAVRDAIKAQIAQWVQTERN